jgi:hypothetical protein
MSEAAPDFTSDQIQRLLRNADRLGFGQRPEGFVLINRARLLAAHGITQTNGQLIDRWVTEAGGTIEALRRVSRETRAVRKHRERTNRPETIVWGIPADALKPGGSGGQADMSDA